MEGIKYINFVEIGLVVFEQREVEFGDYSVRVNNTRVVRATFLTARHTTVCLNSQTVFGTGDIAYSISSSAEKGSGSV